jgi:hypothetical protein
VTRCPHPAGAGTGAAAGGGPAGAACQGWVRGTWGKAQGRDKVGRQHTAPCTKCQVAAGVMQVCMPRSSDGHVQEHAPRQSRAAKPPPSLKGTRLTTLPPHTWGTPPTANPLLRLSPHGATTGLLLLPPPPPLPPPPAPRDAAPLPVSLLYYVFVARCDAPWAAGGAWCEAQPRSAAAAAPTGVRWGGRGSWGSSGGGSSSSSCASWCRGGPHCPHSIPPMGAAINSAAAGGTHTAAAEELL